MLMWTELFDSNCFSNVFFYQRGRKIPLANPLHQSSKMKCSPMTPNLSVICRRRSWSWSNVCFNKALTQLVQIRYGQWSGTSQANPYITPYIPSLCRVKLCIYLCLTWAKTCYKGQITVQSKPNSRGSGQRLRASLVLIISWSGWIWFILFGILPIMP